MMSVQFVMQLLLLLWVGATDMKRFWKQHNNNAQRNLTNCLVCRGHNLQTLISVHVCSCSVYISYEVASCSQQFNHQNSALHVSPVSYTYIDCVCRCTMVVRREIVRWLAVEGCIRGSIPLGAGKSTLVRQLQCRDDVIMVRGILYW